MKRAITTTQREQVNNDNVMMIMKTKKGHTKNKKQRISMNMKEAKKEQRRETKKESS